MKSPLFLLALLFTAAFAHADFIIVQRVDGAAQSGVMTVKVSGNKVRTDISPQVSTITDSTSGDITTLMHAQKVYMIITAAAGKAMVEQMAKVQQAGATPAANPAPPAPSGKTEKINGYTAAEYTFNNGIIKASYWMSTDFPNAKAVSDALAKFRKGSLADMTKSFAPDLSGLPGVPIKSELEFNGQKMTTQLVSAVEAPVDPSEFQVPPGYTQMQMPVSPQ